MDLEIVAIVGLTFVVYFVDTVAYAFRIAGVRTGSIVIAFSLFNILVLLSRTANALQAPFLAKRVETAIHNPSGYSLALDFVLILVGTSVACAMGMALIPTFQRFSTYGVKSFKRHRSVPRLFVRLFTLKGFRLLAEFATIPRIANLTGLELNRDIPVRILLLNFCATALWTAGFFSAIYAGSLDPEYRVTSSMLSPVINGMATVMMFIMVDPYLSALTDDVLNGKATEERFRRALIWLLLSRLAGTIAAQLLLVPSAYAIAFIARLI